MCFYENEIIFTIGFGLISLQAECTYSTNMTIMPLGGKFTSLTGVALSLAYSASRICSLDNVIRLGSTKVESRLSQNISVKVRDCHKVGSNSRG